MVGTAQSAAEGADAARFLVRWECHCQSSPVLLGTYDGGGQIHIKVRDRYWHIRGTVTTVCPRCGSEHQLDLSRRDGEPASRPDGESARRQENRASDHD
ncbi:MAG: hypothetical protein U0031_06580 [Thermomicrobiales bacterium]